jgi:TetR/AcrR family transcriptional repressor of nem operon
MPSTAQRASTADAILDAAERRVAVLGYNGFSYADIATELGVTPASVHYHFPGKVDLGVSLLERYTRRTMDELAAIDANTDDAHEKLEKYAGLYLRVLEGDKLCLCGLMAAELETLAPPIRERLRLFFQQNEDWLTKVIEQGEGSGALDARGAPRAMAAALTGALEGAMIVSRAHGGLASFRSSMQLILDGLRARN